MSIETTLSGFYSSTEQAAKLLRDYQKSIDGKQEKITACISSLKAEDESMFSGSSEIDKLCKNQASRFNKSIYAWQSAVKKYVDGKEFVNKFEKSLLLIVFADVKAGKSSLGNFVSGYSYKDTPYGRFYTKPKHYSYDCADKSQPSGVETEIPEGFEVAVIQATSTIQYFTLLDGLTWVDTPGIHSLSTEYEELAKDYIKYADLILFLTPSTAPWKQDEAEEVEKLLNSGKPLLVAITKSDSTTREVVNGEIVEVRKAKNQVDREAQENRIKTEISKIGHSDVVNQTEYISISTRLANLAVEQNNEELFEQSNFPKFFEQIGRIISEKAVELKMRRPKDELNSVITELVGGSENFAGIDAIAENLRAVKADIAESEKKITQLKAVIIDNVRNKINNEVYSMLCAQKSKGFDNNEISQKVSGIINEYLSKEIASTVGEELGSLDVKLSETDILIDTKFEKKVKTIEYSVYDTGYHTREPRNIFEKIWAFLTDKEYKEFSTVIQNKTRDIEIGDNFNEYADNIWHSALSVIQSRTDAELKRISTEYYSKISNAVGSMESRLNAVRQELEELKY